AASRSAWQATAVQGVAAPTPLADDADTCRHVSICRHGGGRKNSHLSRREDYAAQPVPRRWTMCGVGGGIVQRCGHPAYTSSRCCLILATDAELLHLGGQGGPLHTQARGGAVGPAQYPVGGAQCV